MIKDKLNTPILKEVADQYKISVSELEKVHDSPFKFIREIITSIDFSSMTMEEFHNSKKGFNIPGLCKLYPSEGKFKNINKL